MRHLFSDMSKTVEWFISHKIKRSPRLDSFNKPSRTQPIPQIFIVLSDRNLSSRPNPVQPVPEPYPNPGWEIKTDSCLICRIYATDTCQSVQIKSCPSPDVPETRPNPGRTHAGKSKPSRFLHDMSKICRKYLLRAPRFNF